MTFDDFETLDDFSKSVFRLSLLFDIIQVQQVRFFKYLFGVLVD